MNFFTEKGKNHLEVMNTITQKFGSEVTIISRKAISYGGVLGFFQKEGVEYSGYISSKAKPRTTLDDKNEKEKILNSLKPKIVNNVDQESVKKILDEVKSLKESLSSRDKETEINDVESIVWARNFLMFNDFSYTYIEKMIKKLKNELSYSHLTDIEYVENILLTWIEESIRILPPVKSRGCRVFVIVGPTGVGKTTTIAKIAAQKGLGLSGEEKNIVRIVTIDNYRIGAKTQIERYGEIMKLPVTSCESFDDIKVEVDTHKDVDFIFVDTTGRSPKDFAKLGEMRALLEGCGQDSEVHLAFSASTKSWDIKEIMKQYKPFEYESVIITKLDETTRCGNIISILEEEGIPISYVTTGQDVPIDIEIASKKKLMSLLVNVRHSVKG